MIDDAIADGTQITDISATASGATAGSTSLSVTDDEVAELMLTVDPISISENGGTSTGTVTRDGDTSQALTVNLVSSDTSEATVPVSVTIAAGLSSATFTVTAVDDALLDGTVNVQVTASAAGFASVGAALDVTDDEAPTLTLEIAPASVSENGGVALVTLSRNGDTTDALTVDLASSDTSAVTVPASIG